MNAELKAKWVAALRSGKYRQGQSVLYCKRDDAFCCLGVLHHEITGAKPSRYWNSDQDSSERPEEVAEIDGKLETLTSMNDEGKTFPEIADWIEANL